MKLKPILVGALALTLVGSAAMAVEEPSYRTVLKSAPFEVRDYPALVVADVTVTGGQKEAGGKGFRVLAGYIFGGNRGKQSIAMTAPVSMQPTGEKIAMTAPVMQTRAANEWVVRFTMPARYTLDTLPAPNDPRVQLQTTPPRRVALISFSGYARPDDVASRTAELSAWIESRNLKPIGPPTLAQYNPPWTLWFLRRNEVMIPVEK